MLHLLMLFHASINASTHFLSLGDNPNKNDLWKSIFLLKSTMLILCLMVLENTSSNSFINNVSHLQIPHRCLSGPLAVWCLIWWALKIILHLYHHEIRIFLCDLKINSYIMSSPRFIIKYITQSILIYDLVTASFQSLQRQLKMLYLVLTLLYKPVVINHVISIRDPVLVCQTYRSWIWLWIQYAIGHASNLRIQIRYEFVSVIILKLGKVVLLNYIRSLIGGIWDKSSWGL